MPAHRPRCPRCRWTLSFDARDKSWEARCWNPGCDVGIVPPSVNEPLVAFLRERGEVVARDVAERFDWSNSGADNHLAALLRLGIVTRRRIDPRRGGKRFAWKLT